MAIPQFPTLNDPHIRQLTVCAWLDEDAQTIVDPEGKREGKHLRQIARAGEGEDASFLRLIVGGSGESKGHFHLDIARPSYFPSPPKTSATVEQVGETMSKFYGKDATAVVTFSVIADRSEVSGGSFVNSAILSVTLGNLELKQTGGKFEISGGGSLVGVEWELKKGKGKREEVAVDLQFIVEAKIDERYLLRAYDLVETEWKKWLFGERAEGATS